MKFGNTTCLSCVCQVCVEGLGGCDRQVNCSHKFKMSKEAGRTEQNIQSSHKANGRDEALSPCTGQGGSDQYTEESQGTGCSIGMLPSMELVLKDTYKIRVKNHIGLYWPRWDLSLALGICVLNTLLVG